MNVELTGAAAEVVKGYKEMPADYVLFDFGARFSTISFKCARRLSISWLNLTHELHLQMLSCWRRPQTGAIRSYIAFLARWSSDFVAAADGPMSRPVSPALKR